VTAGAWLAGVAVAGGVAGVTAAGGGVKRLTGERRS